MLLSLCSTCLAPSCRGCSYDFAALRDYAFYTLSLFVPVVMMHLHRASNRCFGQPDLRCLIFTIAGPASVLQMGERAPACFFRQSLTTNLTMA